MSDARAPAGWGWRPAAFLSPTHEQLPDLPELPLLRLIGRGKVTPTIRVALESVPEIVPTLTARQLMEKYGIGRSTAHDVLRQVQA